MKSPQHYIARTQRILEIFLRKIRLAQEWICYGSWAQFIGAMGGVFIMSALVFIILPESALRDLIDDAAHIAMLALFTTKIFAGLPDGIKRANLAILQKKSWYLPIIALVPEELAGWVRLERAIWKGFFGWATRKFPLPPPQGLRIDFLKRSTYSIVFAIVLLALLVEIPFCGVIVSLIEQDPTRRIQIHIILFALTAYSLVWILGDRWLVKHSVHVLTETQITFHIGARTLGTVPRNAIKRVQLVKQSRDKWCKLHKVSMRETVLITPYDDPNVVIELIPHVETQITYFQADRSASRILFLFVSNPELLGSLGNADNIAA